MARLGLKVRACDLLPSLCTPESWKSTLLIGSVLTWMLGVIVFGMSVAMIRKPIFEDSLLIFLSPLYHCLTAAILGAILICSIAFLGCCGAACETPLLLRVYTLAISILYLYQNANGAALIYNGNELFSVVQFVSIEICRQNDRRSDFLKDFDDDDDAGHAGPEKIGERLSRAMAAAAAGKSKNKNFEIEKMLNKFEIENVKVKCPPLKDIATPIGALLIFCATVYLYLAICALLLARHISKLEFRMKEEARARYDRVNMSTVVDNLSVGVAIGCSQPTSLVVLPECPVCPECPECPVCPEPASLSSESPPIVGRAALSRSSLSPCAPDTPYLSANTSLSSLQLVAPPTTPVSIRSEQEGGAHSTLAPLKSTPRPRAQTPMTLAQFRINEDDEQLPIIVIQIPSPSKGK